MSCEICGKQTDLKSCGRCFKANYCGREHQLQHWKEHKRWCIKNGYNNQVVVQDTNSDYQLSSIDNVFINQQQDNMMMIMEQPQQYDGDDEMMMKFFTEQSQQQQPDQQQMIINDSICNNSDNRVNNNFTTNNNDSAAAIITTNQSDDNIVANFNHQDEITDVFFAQLQQQPNQQQQLNFNINNNQSSSQLLNNRDNTVLNQQSINNRDNTVVLNHQSINNRDNTIVLNDLNKYCQIILKDMNKYGFCVIDDFLQNGDLILNEVQFLYRKGFFQPGQVVNLKANSNSKLIRGDRITWVEGNEQICYNIGFLVRILDSIITRCNNLAFGEFQKYRITRRTKAMIACYPSNYTKYVRHVDNPNNDGRCITSIYYLNKDYIRERDGGVLRLFPQMNDGIVADIEPRFNRVIFFWSDRRNPHEVMPSTRMRFAITVWYFDAIERERAIEKYRENSMQYPNDKDLVPF